MKPLRLFLVLLAIFCVSAERASSQQFFTIALDGNAPTQTVNTPATGSGWAVLSADRTQLTYTFVFARIATPITGAHFHLGGRDVRSGMIVHPITVTDNYITGIWTNISALNLDSLLAGKVYLNVHSMQFPGGEIRSQVNPAVGTGYSIAMNGANPIPPINTPARGAGYAVLGADSTLTYRATVVGLSSTLRFAHFHYGGATTPSGPIAVTVIYTDSTTSGIWKLNASALDSLRSGRIYMNVHTVNNGGGEIRGQVRNLAATVSVRELSSNLASVVKIAIAPNPVADMMAVAFALPQSGKVRLQLFDTFGKAVSETLENVWNSGNVSAQFSVSTLPAGVYYCRITLPSGQTLAQGFVVGR